MASLNKVQLIGYLGANPEKKVTTSGTSVVSVNLATTNHYKDQMGQSQSNTDWHRLVFWKNLADNIAMYSKKGALIYIEGRLQTKEWTKDEVRRFTTEIVVERMQFLDRKPQESTDAGSYTPQNNQFAPNSSTSNDVTSNNSQNNKASTNYPEAGNNFVEDDDIPF